MNILDFKDSVEAFNGINGIMIFDEDFIRDDGIYSKSQTIAYDTLIRIKRSYVPEEWDFTATVNYRKMKWVTLTKNYIDEPHLQEVLSEVHSREMRDNKAYNISMHFANLHGGGKGCLLTLTFTRRPGNPDPILIATVRASEVYKRLMMDLLLLHRIGQECYGEDAKFGIEIFVPHMWQGVSWGAMWLSWQPEKVVQDWLEIHGPSPFQQAVFEKLKYFRSADYSKFNYNADKRAAKVIQGKVESPPLLASDCLI